MRLSITLSLALFLAPWVLAASSEIESTPSLQVLEPASDASPTPRTLTYTDALVLGVVEGVTEYLPVSSTGHLILTNRVLGLDDPTPIGETGEYSLKEAVDAYAIVIQGGAIIAVILLYWRRILDVIRGFLGQSSTGLLLGRNLIAAFMPAAIIGLLLDDLIDAYLFNPTSIIIALVTGAFLMLWIEHRRKKQFAGVVEAAIPNPELHDLSLKQSLMIGFFQCVAMWPGTSRSMMTIVGGYCAGLRPARAAEFSFLLGLITLTAASGYKTLTKWDVMTQTLDLGPVVVGILVATVVAAISVKWLVNYLTRHGLALFAWYRIGLAALFTLALATGYID